MNRYALFIDSSSCWGCKTCEVACKQENQAPDGIKYISVSEDGPKMVEGRLDFVYRVNRCLHCDNPPCAETCPAEAITKRDDGLVILDYESCTGCALCVEACPYNAIGYDDKMGKAHKCNLCVHRVDTGLIPACADNVCLAHCIVFAPADQGEQMIAGKILLKERLAADREGR
jgi:Fe-S-cluster-containing dehydrogenase component